MPSPTPHDSFFRAVFSRPDHARDQLRAVLPEQLTRKLDLSSLRAAPGSFVDPELAERHSDLLYEVNIAGRKALLFVLFEHSSTFDPMLPVRLLVYMGRIWDQWLRKTQNPKRVPAILPLVLHQGPDAWAASTEFLDLVDLPPELLEAVRSHLPSFRFVLDDLPVNADELLKRRMASALGSLTLLLLRHARDSDEAILAFLATQADLLNALENGDDRTLVWTYILSVTSLNVTEVERSLGDRLDPRTREALMTLAEHLIQKSKQQGLVQGEQRMLLRQLRRRFGEVPSSVEDRVLQADETDLLRWGDRVLNAESLAQVFAEPDPS